MLGALARAIVRAAFPLAIWAMLQSDSTRTSNQVGRLSRTDIISKSQNYNQVPCFIWLNVGMYKAGSLYLNWVSKFDYTTSSNSVRDPSPKCLI